MNFEIQRYTGNPFARSYGWTDLSEKELRLRAIRAVNERDEDELWSLLEAFLVLHGRPGARVSKYTLSGYRSSLRRFMRAWQGVNLFRPGRDAGLELLRTLEDQGQSASTIGVTLTVAKTLYKALRWAGAVTASPFEFTRAPRDSTPPEEKRQAYSGEAIEKLLQAATPLERVLVLLGAHGGLRAGEIMALEWRDVQLSDRTLTVRSGKGSKRRRVTISRSLRDALQAYWSVSDSLRVTPYGSTVWLRKAIRDLCKRAGVEYLALHSLRHYCATRVYEETNDLRLAQQHLGHSSIDTTGIYAKFSRRRIDEAIGAW
jgi:integrase/recombinase XerC